MFALVESESITKYLNGNKGIQIGDLKYPRAIYTLWTEAERNAIGIYEIEIDKTNLKNTEYYTNTTISYTFANNKVTGSYGSATARDIDEAKVLKIKEINKDTNQMLSNTDWYITRNAEKSTTIPSAISTHRDAVRTKQASMETAITNASNTSALETLFTYTEQEDGTVTRPLGELPTL
jgi:hypothetical protein